MTPLFSALTDAQRRLLTEAGWRELAIRIGPYSWETAERGMVSEDEALLVAERMEREKA